MLHLNTAINLEKKEDEPSDNRKLFEALFRLVSKNKELPAALDAIPANDPKLKKLLTSIQEGHPRAKIFSDPKCHLYLLRLMRDEKISFWHGMTVYVYLMALMQQSSKQPLKYTDQVFKMNRKMRVIKLVKKGKISKTGKKYLRIVCENFAELNYKIDYQALENLVLKLPPSEQWLIGFNFFNITENDRAPFDTFMTTLTQNIPFTPANVDIEQKTAKLFNKPRKINTSYIPSSSIIDFCIRQMGPEPMQGLPGAGSLNPSSLNKLHDKNIHPIATFLSDIKSNVRSAHHYKNTALIPVWLHDIGHLFWANMLSKKERDFIFYEFAPSLTRMLNKASAHDDQTSVTALQEIINAVYDFDLTYVKDYKDPKTRLSRYISSAFHINKFEYDGTPYFNHNIFYTLSKVNADRLFYLIAFEINNLDTKNKKLKKEWKTLYNIIKNNCGYANQNIIQAIEKLAAHSGDPVLPTNDVNLARKINLGKWKKLLESTSDSKELWQKIAAHPKRYQELFTLINSCNLMFFHPYLPMTGEMYKNLLEIIKSHMNPSHIDKQGVFAKSTKLKDKNVELLVNLRKTPSPKDG